jgi:hypothetical protein
MINNVKNKLKEDLITKQELSNIKKDINKLKFLGNTVNKPQSDLKTEKEITKIK